MKVIVVSVAEIPGGVFTAVPESYYADNDGNVLPYLDLTKWKQELINSYKGIIFFLSFYLFFRGRGGTLVLQLCSRLLIFEEDTANTTHRFTIITQNL